MFGHTIEDGLIGRIHPAIYTSPCIVEYCNTCTASSLEEWWDERACNHWPTLESCRRFDQPEVERSSFLFARSLMDFNINILPSLCILISCACSTNAFRFLLAVMFLHLSINRRATLKKKKKPESATFLTNPWRHLLIFGSHFQPWIYQHVNCTSQRKWVRGMLH